MNTKFMPVNENFNEMQSFNHIVSSSTPKPTVTPPSPPPAVDNLYSQSTKYASFHSPANSYYYHHQSMVSPQYLTSASTSTPVSYYNNNNGYNHCDSNYTYQYNSQIDSGYNSSYCPTINNSQLIDSNYHTKSCESFSNRNSYFTDSAYSSPVLNGLNVSNQKPNKLFTIDSILNDKCENRSNKENTIPNLDSTNNEGAESVNETSVQTISKSRKTSRNNSKRVRTIFTQDQLDKLEIEFMKQQYMVGSERYYLANELNLNEAQVKIWFQNRRIKWRKENVELKRSNNNEIARPHSPNTNDSISNE
jgi:hypothetical protein